MNFMSVLKFDINVKSFNMLIFKCICSLFIENKDHTHSFYRTYIECFTKVITICSALFNPNKRVANTSLSARFFFREDLFNCK
jgi:hypothetical protein